MSLRDSLREFALTLPEAWEDFPWGESTLKVRKKVFVFLGHGDNADFGMSVKLPLSGADVLADYADAKPTGYGLGKSGWVSLKIPADEEPDVPALQALIEESYRAVAPKKLAKLVEL